MKIVKPNVEFLTSISRLEMLQAIETYGRTCYKSESAITDASCKKFFQQLIKRGHESVLEHVSLTVKFTIDRGVSHEIVRHRIASYSQESTRYVNYGGKDIEFICPPEFLGTQSSFTYHIWATACEEAEKSYKALINLGVAPENARSVLPNSLKTELVMTANLRGWRHFLKLRTSKFAHPQMREVAMMIYTKLQEQFPEVVEDIIL